jgi:Flp pilus assembly protein TadB
LQESNQEEEMKRMSNVVLQESNQEEERKNRKPTQLDGVLQESNQGCENTRQGNSGWQEQISMLIWQPSSLMENMYFINIAAHGARSVSMVVGTFIFPVLRLGLGRNVALTVACLRPVTVTILMRN